MDKINHLIDTAFSHPATSMNQSVRISKEPTPIIPRSVNQSILQLRSTGLPNRDHETDELEK